MSIKHFCDCCGEEIVRRNYVTDRLRGSVTIKSARVDIEVTVGIRGTWNAGDLCVNCLFIALDRLDPRPRAAEAA